jgi:CheY-like chemotaxis protein
MLLLPVLGRSQSIEQLQRELRQAKETKNLKQQAQYLNKLGYAYWDQQDLTSAINAFEESIALNQTLNNSNALITLNTNIGLLYNEQLDYKNAISAFEKSLQTANKQKRKSEQMGAHINLGTTYQAMGKHENAIAHAQKALALAQELSNMPGIRTAYGLLAENHKALNNSEEAFKYFNLFSSIDKHIKSEEIKEIKSESENQLSQLSKEKQEKEQALSQTSQQLATTKDSLKQSAALAREQQLQLKLNEATIEQQKIEQKIQQQLMVGLIIIFLIVLAFSIFVYRQFQQKKKVNRQLSEQNNQIREQKREIENQRDIANRQKKKITDSINYAKRIQRAILPPEAYLEQNMPEHFIFFMPRDIVSGDFYWALKRDEKLVLAAADCTGHGVPGAMMSMLGTAFLNEIVNKMVENKHITALQPSEILNQLRRYIITSLHQTGAQDEAKDGIDISLVVLDLERKELQYAGAHNPLYIIRDNQLIEHKGDRMPVSIHRNADKPFTNHEIKLQDNDRLYLFSDGFPDQLGGTKGRKYMSRKFKEFLLSIHNEPMHVQEQLLKQEHLRWRGETSQLDDLLVIGLKMTPDAYKFAEEGADKYEWHNNTVLIAEDTDMNFVFLMEALKPTGINVMRAHDGKEAIALCEDNRFIDLVLMDINMPHVDGFEATRQIKANRNIPVIAQTALHISEAEEKSKEAGCDDYILKPIRLNDFLATIAKYLR